MRGLCLITPIALTTLSLHGLSQCLLVDLVMQLSNCVVLTPSFRLCWGCRQSLV